MSTHDAVSVALSTEVRYYERAAVQSFLERAAAARDELDAALRAALVREERAHAALEQTRYAGFELEAEAAALIEALREEREAAWDVVGTTIADADAEAAAILTAAEEVAALRSCSSPQTRQAGPVLPLERRRPPSLDRLVGHPLHTARRLAG